MEYPEATKKAALIVSVNGFFVSSFMGSSINVALPAITRSFQVDAVQLSWIPMSYLLAIGVILVPMGRLSDIFGRKKIMTLGFTIFMLASLFSALSPSVITLIIFRTFQGVGAGMFFGTTMAILTAVYPPGERGKVLGITVSAVYIGLSSGPFIGGILTTQLGWRSLFALSFCLSLLVIGLIFSKLKGEWAEAKGEAFDIWGSLVYGLTLVCLTIGISLLPERKSLMLILLSALGLATFVFLEKRVASPVFQMNVLLRNRVFALSNLAALIHYSSTFAVTFLLSLYLQYIQSLDAQTAGLVLMAQPVMMAFFSPLAGKLSDRFEPRLISSSGMALTCCGLLLFTRLTSETGLGYIVSTLLLLGFGFAIFSSPNTNAIMSSVERRFLGVASGIAGTMRVLGQLFSMGIATLVLVVVMERTAITPAVYPLLIQSIRICLVIFSCLTFAAIFASLARGNIRQS